MPPHYLDVPPINIVSPKMTNFPMGGVKSLYIVSNI